MLITSPAELQGLTFMTALSGAVALKGYDAGISVQETTAISRIVPTQRKRYGFVLSAQLMLAWAPIWCIAGYGVTKTRRSLVEWWSIPVIGWLVVVMATIAIVSPLITLLGCWWIYTHPAKLAKKTYRQRGYLFTDDIRNKVSNPRRAWIYRYRDEHGYLQKEYRYDN